MRRFFISAVSIIISCLFIDVLIESKIQNIVYRILDGQLSGIKDLFVSGFYVFICLFLFIGIIFFICTGIYNLIRMYFETFFKNEEKDIHLYIDKNCIIKNSYVELSNGKQIPIKIHKIEWEKTLEEEAKKAEETKE